MAEYLVFTVDGGSSKRVGTFDADNTEDAVKQASIKHGDGHYAAVSARSWKEHIVKSVTQIVVESPTSTGTEPDLSTPAPFTPQAH